MAPAEVRAPSASTGRRPSGRGPAPRPRGADDRLRPAGAGAGDQRGDGAPSDPPRLSRWWWPRGPAAAARWSTTWARRRRRPGLGARQHRRLDPRALREGEGSTPSSSTPPAAAPRSRTTASCCARMPSGRRAARISAIARDVTEYLTNSDLSPPPPGAGSHRRLSHRLLDAARPAGSASAQGAAGAPASRCEGPCRRAISAAARPAPTTFCSRPSSAPEGAQGRQHRGAPGPTSSPPATSAA
jgi:hypothetical protein